MVLQNLWKTTLRGLWCTCAIERAVEGFALTDHDFGNLLPSLSLPFRFLWRGPFNKIGEGYFQYTLEHCKCQFICVWNLNLKFINWDIVKGWNPESRIQHDRWWCQVVPGGTRWYQVVPGLGCFRIIPCDHLVGLKAQVGLTDLVGLVVLVGLVTILKDCLESSHFRRQWASSVRQLVGTAH